MLRTGIGSKEHRKTAFDVLRDSVLQYYSFIRLVENPPSTTAKVVLGIIRKSGICVLCAAVANSIFFVQRLLV